MKKLLAIILLVSQFNAFGACGCGSSSNTTSTSSVNNRVTESREKTDLRNRITKLNQRVDQLKKYKNNKQITRIQKQIATLNAKLLAMK